MGSLLRAFILPMSPISRRAGYLTGGGADDHPGCRLPEPCHFQATEEMRLRPGNGAHPHPAAFLLHLAPARAHPPERTPTVSLRCRVTPHSASRTEPGRAI